MRSSRAPLFAAVLALLLAPAAAPAQPPDATIRVDTIAEDDPARCTITNAILSAESNAAVGGCQAGRAATVDVIWVPAGTYTITSPYVNDFWGNSTAFPVITSALVIQGAGRDLTIIERPAGAFFRFRFFYARAALELRDLTLGGGDVSPDYSGGAVFTEDHVVVARHVRFTGNRARHGGAIADLNYFGTNGGKYTIVGSRFDANSASTGGAINVSPGGSLIVRDTTVFVGNTASASGGAIHSWGGAPFPTIDIADTEFQLNRADGGNGGAIHAPAPALTRVKFVANVARDGGGALYGSGRPVIDQSTLERNSARQAGAIHLAGGTGIEVRHSTFLNNVATDFSGGAILIDDRVGASTIVNSTFSGNKAVDRGGAVYLHGGTLTINNVTATANTSNYGPGLALGSSGGTKAWMSNSIFAGGIAGGIVAQDIRADPSEQLTSLGHNIVGSDQGVVGLFTAVGDQVGTPDAPLDAGLLPLASNGGPTQTHALAASSRALDRGSAAGPGQQSACEPADQRGEPRPGAGSAGCDIGAYEHATYFTLTITVQGGAFGGVAIPPIINDCRDTCTVRLGGGAPVRLTAFWSTDARLIAWGGACSYAGTAATCDLTMDGDKAVTAAFALPGGATETTLMTSPNPSTEGEPVTINVRVVPVPPAFGTPTGLVAISSPSANLVRLVPLGPDGTVSIEHTFTAPVDYIKASYGGDERFGVSEVFANHSVLHPAPNIPPTTNMADLLLFEGQPAVFSILLTDAENDPITAALTGLPPGVTVTRRLPGDDGLPYHHFLLGGMPEPGSAGVYPVVLTMSDGVNTVTQSSVITVRAPNEAPVAVDDFVTVGPNTITMIPVLANDSDPEGDALRVVSATKPVDGILEMRDDGIIYTPTRQGFYTDRFTYTVQDRFGSSATATVVVRALSAEHDLTVSIVPSRLILSAGQTAVWSVTVTNQSVLAMPSVSVMAELPAPFVFRGASLPRVDAALRFEVGDIPAGESRSVEVEANAPPEPGLWLHSAGVAGGVPDDPSNNTASGVFEVQPAFCFAPSNGRLGWWPFDDGFTDVLQRNSTLASNVMLQPSRSGNAAAFFQGMAGAVALGAPASPMFTVAAWALADGSVGLGPVLGNTAAPDLELSGFWLGFEAGYPVARIYRPGLPPVRLAAPSTAVNRWTHLALTHDGVAVRLFVNGFEKASAAVDQISPATLTAGSALTGGEVSAFVGLIDDVMVYDRALLPEELLRTVAGDAIRCGIPTERSLSVEMSVLPEMQVTGSTVILRTTITNTSDGYLGDAQLAWTLDRLLAFRDAADFWERTARQAATGPLMAGESRMFTAWIDTPDIDGRFPVAVTARESLETEFTASAVVVVAPPSCFDGGLPLPGPCPINERPVVTNPGPRTSRLGEVIALQIVAADPDGPEPLQFSAENLPPGLSIDASTGLITGVILPGGAAYVVTVSVFDGKIATLTSFLWRTNVRLSIELGRGGVLQVGDLVCDATAGPASCVTEVEPGTVLAVAIPNQLPGATGTWWTELNQQGPAPLAIEMTTSRALTVRWTVPFSMTLVNPSGPFESLLGANVPITVDGPLPQRLDYLACWTGARQCAGRVEYGAEVFVQGRSNDRRVVAGYAGPCSDVGCTFAADRPDLAITITYEPRPLTLTVETGAGGVVSFGDVVCLGGAGGQVCSATIPYGTQVTLVPSAAAGVLWTFEDLSGLPDVLSLPQIHPPFSHGLRVPAPFTMDTNHRVKVTFVARFTLALPGLVGTWDKLVTLPDPTFPSAYPVEWADASQIPGVACDRSLDYATPCLMYRTWGQPVTFAARQSLPYQFMGWSGACTGIGACTITPGDDLVAVTGRFGRAPIARPYGPVGLDEDLFTLVPLGLLFSDPNDDLASYVPSVDADWLRATIEGANLRLQPAANRWGTATVTIIATDATGFSATATLIVHVIAVNDQPSIDPIADMTVIGTIPVRVEVTGLNVGPYEDDQTLTLSVRSDHPFTLQDLRIAGDGVAFTPDATPPPNWNPTTVTVMATDSEGGLAFRQFQVTIKPANTLPGTGVDIAADGPLAGSPITLRFPRVTAAGHTSFTVERNVLLPPNGFRFGSPPLTFDISTTASYVAPVQVCISYAGMKFAKPLALRLWHYENGAWVDRTISNNAVGQLLCGSVSSLSPFALAEPEDIPGRMHGEGELSAGDRDFRLTFHVAERELGRESGRVKLSIAGPKSAKSRHARDEFESTAIDAIAFWNDPGVAPGRWKRPRALADSVLFTGRGRWNGKAGYTFEASATDHGEPGRGRDIFAITVRNAAGVIVATATGTLDKGNIQADWLGREGGKNHARRQ